MNAPKRVGLGWIFLGLAVLTAVIALFVWDIIPLPWQKSESSARLDADTPQIAEQVTTALLPADSTTSPAVVQPSTVQEPTSVGVQPTAPAIAAQTADTSSVSATAAVSKPQEKATVKPDSAKTVKPKLAASAWQAKVDSVLSRTEKSVENLNVQLADVRLVNSKQDSQIKALAVDVDWLVLQQARLYSSLKSGGEIVANDIQSFISATVDERDRMWEALRPSKP